MKTISHLEVFVKVVESGSFSEAARYFDITPSAVSRQVSQLEEELGARLDLADKFVSHAVTDGKLVTGQNPQSSEAVAQAVIIALSEQSQ